jgi:hypothetical protein
VQRATLRRPLRFVVAELIDSPKDPFAKLDDIRGFVRPTGEHAHGDVGAGELEPSAGDRLGFLARRAGSVDSPLKQRLGAPT